MDHEALLDEYTEKIEEELKTYLQKKVEEGRRYHPFIGEVYSDLEEFILRKGKRLASSSTLIIYEGYTGALDSKIMKVGVGIELYRHSILIHDDLVDRDDYRRGGKTFHNIFKKDRRYGDGIAIFTGNLLYALALESILNSGFGMQKLKRVVNLFARDYIAVNESQMLDLDFEYRSPDEEEWYIMASKRASSLFHATILSGAILGGAEGSDIKLLAEAAENIGYSFDIQDDIIGTFANEEQYGRPPGGDLVYWKKPLHMVYTMKLADESELKEIKEAIGNKENIENVREIIRRTGALEKAKEKSRIHAKRAIELISQTKLNRTTKEFFSSFITYVAESLDWYK
jgi:geranylgeranyl diphosphate synthase type I